MLDDASQRPYPSRAARFVQWLLEIHAKVVAPLADEVVQLAGEIEGIQSKDKPYLFSHPIALYRLTSCLRQKTSPTMGELSNALSVPLSTATRMVNRLVENALAERLSDPDDRRIVRVALTDTDLQVHDAIEAHSVQDIQRILACLTPEEQDILIALFRKVASSLKESKT